MTASNLARIVFRKDVRALRYPLLLMLVVALVEGFFLLHPNQEGSMGATRVILSQFLGFILIAGTFLLTLQLIFSDPTGREFRFLATRPVPGASVGLAKAWFLALFLFVPYWLAREFLIAHAGLVFTPLDHLLLLAETIVTFGGSLALIVLLGIFSRSSLAVFLTLVVLILGGSILFAWWNHRPITSASLPPLPTLEHERLLQFQTFFAKAIFLAASLWAIKLRYCTRDFKTPLAVVVLGLVPSLIAFHCPYNLAQPLDDHAILPRPLTLDQFERIQMTLVTPKGKDHSYSLSGGSSNGTRYVILNQPVHLEGIATPCYVETVSYKATVTLRSGKTFSSNFSDSNAHGGVGGLHPEFMANVAGVRPSSPLQEDVVLDLLTYLPADLTGEDLTGATVRGVITLNVRRAYLAGSLPLQMGASLGLYRRRYEVTQAGFAGDRVTVVLSDTQAPLALRGDLVNWTGKDDLRCLVVYRPLSEALRETRSSGGGESSTFGVHVGHLERTYTSPPRDLAPGWQPLPADWASGAELIFIGSDSCGEITLPYEIENVDLHYKF